MAYLAMRGSGAVNGVSRLHGQVSRHIFLPLFPRWPEAEIPVGHVTNGVHVPSWDSAESDSLWMVCCGKDRWLGSTEALQHDIRCISSARLWEYRNAARASLVEYARERLSQLLASWALHRIGSSAQSTSLIRTFSRWALRAGSPLTSARICCCTIRNGCCASSPTPSGRCSSSSRARRIPPIRAGSP